MAAITELLRTEENGTISFGDHTLSQKAKKEDYESGGDVYKVKTYSALTKLEKNGLFLYESVPGTGVSFFEEKEDGVQFTVSGSEDAQITIGLKEATEYEIFVGDESMGKMSTGVSGKLSVSVELNGMGEVPVKIKQV